MTQNEFIKAITAAAQKYAPKYGIKVVSPIIAQACLESGYGTSDKAQYHNYFGLKYRENRITCNNGYITANSSEQRADGTYYKITTKWFKFDSLEKGVEGYFQFINNDNYANLKGVTDPYQYLVNIKADGYATSLKYVDNVYAVVKKWNLTQYDNFNKKPANAKPKVCIDAGHYGKYNKCPNNPAYYESEVMWDLHLLQKKYLEQLGIDVITTRADQKKDLDLIKRGKTAKGCDLFISDHSNAVGSGMNESIDYVAVYHLVDDKNTSCDELSKEIADKLDDVIAKVMGVQQGGRISVRKSDNDRNNDGLKNDNYYGVLHGARSVEVPGLIIEHSFHTNSKVVDWLLDDSNLDKLARAEAECIASWLLKKTVKLPAAAAPSAPTELYRVRKSWAAASTQIGAYSVLENAKKNADSHPGYFVFDSKGNVIYPEIGEEYLVNTFLLNMRKGPGASYPIVGTIKKNSIVEITKVDGNWGKMKGLDNWVSMKYLKKKVETPVEPPKPQVKYYIGPYTDLATARKACSGSMKVYDEKGKVM